MSDLARDVLDSIESYVNDPNLPPSSADRPVRFGVIDPAYSGTGNAKVTFDGEGTMSLRTYVVMSPVAASDRVALLPAGRSYVILGKLGGGAWLTALTGRVTTAEGKITSLEGDRPGTAGHPFVMASGIATANATASGSSAPIFWNALQTVTFPVSRFSVVPVLQVTIVDTTPGGGTIAAGQTIEAHTAASFQVRLNRLGATPPTGYRIHWTAVQMLSGAAAG